LVAAEGVSAAVSSRPSSRQQDQDPKEPKAAPGVSAAVSGSARPPSRQQNPKDLKGKKKLSAAVSGGATPLSHPKDSKDSDINKADKVSEHAPYMLGHWQSFQYGCKCN
jgi:hypothetical protein